MTRTSSSTHSTAYTRTRRRRILLWSLALLLIAAIGFPLGGYVYLVSKPAYAQSSAGEQQQTNPRANYWRAVRDGTEGYTSASGPYTTDVLIQNGGQNWREIRNGPLVAYGAALMGIVLAAIVIFYLVRGRVRLEGGRAGVKVPRWELYQRVIHWFVAVTFILLAVTGLILLYGRAILIPVFGLDFFAAAASACKTTHNLLGPLFVVGLVLMILNFIRGNLPEPGDLQWFAKGGGMLRQHVSAGALNAGEKVWFWVVTVMGLSVAVTGLVLDFPIFGQTRELMQWSQIIHAIAAIIFVSGALGHIYIGTLGMEGSFESMATGYVDANWAKAHHDRWYADMQRQGKVGAVMSGEEPSPGRGKPAGHRA